MASVSNTKGANQPLQNIEKELEELREKNYRLKLNIESMKQLHQNELEYLKDEIQLKEKENKTLQDNIKLQYKKRNSQVDSEDTFIRLSENCTALKEENSDLKIQLAQLQKTFDQMKTSHVDRHVFHEENEALKIQSDRLNIELKNAQDLLEQQQARVHDLNQQLHHQRNVASELQEELDSRDGYISELQSRIKDLEKDKQEAVMELQQTLMLQQNAKQEENDPNRKGNSLFSEVDDRRVRVEDELRKLRSRLARLSAENHELKTKAEKGNSRATLIYQQLQVIQKNEIDVFQELKKMQSETLIVFSQYRDRLDALKNEYKRKLIQYRDRDTQVASTLELEKLREERDLLLSQKMGLDQELWEMRKELKFARYQFTESDAICKIFRMKLQALQESIMSGDVVSVENQKPVSLNSPLTFSPFQTTRSNCAGDNSSLNLSLYGTCSAGADENPNRKWMCESILNETLKEVETKSPIKSSPHELSSSNPASNCSQIKSKSPNNNTVAEEIPECHQQ